ncbi:MAG: hypothetical protein AB1690_02500 [Candidatus Zixiibacteriota bacterium]
MPHLVYESFWEEDEYRSADELVVARLIMDKRDMSGVCPLSEKISAQLCRMRTDRFRRIVDYFESIGKLEISADRSHVWWVSGMYYSLAKGKYSKSQMMSCVRLLKKWGFSGIFEESKRVKEYREVYVKNRPKWYGNGTLMPSKCPILPSFFVGFVLQVYVNKYGLVIPYADYLNLNLDSDSDSDKGISESLKIRKIPLNTNSKPKGDDQKRAIPKNEPTGLTTSTDQKDSVECQTPKKPWEELTEVERKERERAMYWAMFSQPKSPVTVNFITKTIKNNPRWVEEYKLWLQKGPLTIETLQELYAK